MQPYLPRHIASLVSKALRTMPVVVLTGMRQVGKTTLLRSEPDLRDRRYLSLDDFATEAAAHSAPESLLGEDGPVTIDEVQKAPELLPAIKAAVDRDRRPGRFLLSGSANLLLLESVSESLAGRAVYLQLWPLTLAEQRRIEGEPVLIELLRTGSPRFGDAAKGFSPLDAVRGGMPPVVLDQADPGLWYLGFEQTYLERDVRRLTQVADLAQFRRFLRLVALRTGNLLNLSEIARDAHLSPATASRYLGILEASFAVHRVQPHLASRAARLVKSSKVHLSDAGLAHHLIGTRGAPMTEGDPHAGALLETFVAQNLAGLVSAWCAPGGATVQFWNVQGRYEVDFVVEAFGRTVALEVKRGTRFSESDLRGLRRFLELTPSCVMGILAYGGTTSVAVDERIWAVPIEQVLI